MHIDVHVAPGCMYEEVSDCDICVQQSLGVTRESDYTKYQWSIMKLTVFTIVRSPLSFSIRLEL